MSQKTICVIGASSGVGLQCVEVALARAHRVVTLSRSIDALPDHPQLTKVQGNATRVEDVRRAIDGADAVLVCLGTRQSLQPTTVFSDCGKALLQLQDVLGQTPVQILSGFGAGDSAQYHGWLTSLLFKLLLARVYVDKTALEDLMVASPLNWMLVRPGVLTNGQTKGPARVQVDYVPGMKVGSVTRRAVAEFMVGQAETPTLMRCKPALSAR